MVPATLHEARDFVLATMKMMAETKKPGEPVMFHSSPGVGKSAVIAQCGDIMKNEFESAFNSKFKIWDVRVGAMMESDIQGIPYPATVEVVNGLDIKDMFFSTPAWWPKEGECGILLMDELANAPIPNQHACYRVLHDRTIHNGSRLPDGVIVLAAGNTTKDKTGAKALVPALARRFAAHFLIKPSVSEFVAHAIEQDIDPLIPAYLNYEPDALVGTAIDGEYGFPCPANWFSVDGMLKNKHLQSYANSNNPNYLLDKGIVSCLGSTKGLDFVGFQENRAVLPDFNEIMETGKYEPPEGFDLHKNRGVMWTIISALTSQLARLLREDDVEWKKVDNLSAVLEVVDTSSAGVCFRSLRMANSKAMGKLLLTSKAPNMKKMVNEVMTRTSVLANNE